MSDSSGHVYDATFFAYIERGSFASARVITPFIKSWLHPESVIDFGCGRGAWLDVWRSVGVETVMGVDGDYVRRDQLHIAPDAFQEADLNAPISLGRRFDLATSFEVAEHLNPLASRTFVKSLVDHADAVLFSAATPGQGGEHHINERPLSHWRALFADHGYKPFDLVRPNLQAAKRIEPWYRYNMVLYANPRAISRFNDFVLRHAVADEEPLADFSGLAWRVRTAAVRPMPRRLVDWIAVRNAHRLARRAQRNAADGSARP